MSREASGEGKQKALRRVCVDLDSDTYQRFHVRAITRGEKMTEVLRASVEAYLAGVTESRGTENQTRTRA